MIRHGSISSLRTFVRTSPNVRLFIITSAYPTTLYRASDGNKNSFSFAWADIGCTQTPALGLISSSKPSQKALAFDGQMLVDWKPDILTMSPGK